MKENLTEEINEIGRPLKENLEVQIEKSKFSKYFWNTIIIIFVVYIIIAIFALINNSSSNEQKKPLIGSFLTETTNKVIKNLENSEPDIRDKFLKSKNEILQNIDENIDETFEVVINKNIDVFLDFHYSLIGGYIELYTMTFSNYEELISEKLFGDSFVKNFDKAKINIDNFYNEKEKEDLEFIKNKAMNGIDLELNRDELNKMNELFIKELNFQKSQLIAGGVGSVIAVRLAATISSKIASKIALKTGTKAAVKSSAKVAAVTTGATSGVACGPFAIICAPALAIGGWMATDIAINTADEQLNRESFKKEIEELIIEEKKFLKNNMKSIYINAFNKTLEEYMKMLKNTKIKEQRYIENIK